MGSGEVSEMLTPAVTLPAGVAVGQCFFRRISDSYTVMFCNICIVLFA